MKRSLALAVCGFSLVLALVGGWLADRQFTAALDTLADQAVLQHQRNLFGYADTLQEVKADDSPHMILADDSGTRYVNASDKAFAGQLYFDRQRLIVGSVPCTFALLDQTGRVIYSKLPDTIPESELAALKDADTTTMRLCGQTLLLCDQVAGASGQRVWVWMVTALDTSSAYAVRTATLRQWFLLQAVLTLAALLMVHHTTALQQLNDRQSRFVADLTHELKTPLAGIRLLTDSILQTEDMNADTTREFVEDIGREAQRLSRITEDLLRLTRLDSGIQDAAYPVSVSRVLERVVRMLGVVAREKEVTLTYETDEDAVVRATEDDIHQILYNLMENGIKYSGSMGFVHTTLKTVGDTVVISVEDNGIGIPDEDMEHVFERFYRVDKNRSRAVGGTGLGLSIVSDTVRRRGGSIRAQHRQSGSGTVFIVELPLARREEADE